MRALGIAVIILGSGQVPQAAAQWKPLFVTGYNVDVITDRDTNVRFAQKLGDVCCAWFESGAIDDVGTEHDNGLAAGTTFESRTASGVVYLILPAVLNNALQLRPGETGTLTLGTPAPYSQIAVISSSGNASHFSVGTGTINYDDGSSLSFDFNNFDWCNGRNEAPHPEAAVPSAFDKIGRNVNSLLDGTKFTYAEECDFQLYETIVATNNTKNIVSIDFLGPADAHFTQVMGVSGSP
jgi:hypothetical protein